VKKEIAPSNSPISLPHGREIFPSLSKEGSCLAFLRLFQVAIKCNIRRRRVSAEI